MSTERTDTTADVAKFYGVEPRTVTRWAAGGCPHDRDGAGLRFIIEEVRAWLATNNLTGRPGHQPRPVSPEQAAAASEADYWLGRFRRIRALIEEGAMMRLVDHDRAITRLGTWANQELQAMPTALAPRLVGLDTAEQQAEIQAYVNRITDHLLNPENHDPDTLDGDDHV